MSNFTPLPESRNDSGNIAQEDITSSFNIRKIWHKGEWYYSVVDIIAEASDRDQASAVEYWRKLRNRLGKEGNETVTKLDALKLPARDGKMRKTEVVNVEQALRLLQEIPGTRTDKIKNWLAVVGAERLEETEDPETGVITALDRAAERYRAHGKSDTWIQARLQGIVTRKQFVDALNEAVAQVLTSMHYAVATDEVYKGLWGRTAAILKEQLELSPKANLRDHQPELALIYQRIAEAVAKEKLGERTELTWAEARLIVRVVADRIGKQAQDTSAFLNTDLATGRPLLSGDKP